MRKVGYSLVLTGLLLVGIFALSDFFGSGKDRSIGAAQLLGIQLGALLVLLGIGLITVKWEGKFQWKGQLTSALEKILNLPPTAWVLAVFLLLYVFFFLSPVFFSKLQIQYFQRYIPNAFVTRIGFDIESIITRIQDWITLGQSPYSDGFIAYPPLTILTFAPLIIIGYPAYFKLMVSLTFGCYLVGTLMIPLLILPKGNRSLLFILFITGLFSYGLQFEMERGQFNLIAFTLCILAIYIFHYHYKFRYFAYLLFSLSIQFKVYPVFFIVMLIKDWRAWKENLIRMIGLGIFNFALLFIMGFQMFIDFFHSITAYQMILSSRYENLSLKGFVHKLSLDGFGLIPPDQVETVANHATMLTAIFLIICGLCFISAIVYAYLQKSVGLNPYLFVICTVLALVIPSISNDYKLSILTVPMILTFGCLPTIESPRRKLFSTLLIIISSAAFWSTLYPYNVKPQILASNFPALMIVLVSITILYFVMKGKYETLTTKDA